MMSYAFAILPALKGENILVKEYLLKNSSTPLFILLSYIFIKSPHLHYNTLKEFKNLSRLIDTVEIVFLGTHAGPVKKLSENCLLFFIFLFLF
jgi:hypothetical protein